MKLQWKCKTSSRRNKALFDFQFHLLCFGHPSVLSTETTFANKAWSAATAQLLQLGIGGAVLVRHGVELATTRLDVHNDVHGLGMSTDP